MKKINFLLVVIFVITACSQTQPEEHQVELGLFTAYYVTPEILNGQVKEIYERVYYKEEENGQAVKGDRMTVAAHDTLGWTNDFHVQFDENGNITVYSDINENDEEINRNVFNYDGDKLIKIEFYRDDTLRRVIMIDHDENGKMNSMANYRMPEDTLLATFKMIRDENDNIKEIHRISYRDELTGKWIFSLDENGKRTGYNYFNADGEKTYEEEFTYNDMMFLARQAGTNREGKERVYEYTYEYDDKGNWTVCISDSEEPSNIYAERKISYYQD